MATKVATGTAATCSNAASLTVNSPSASAGNKLVLQIAWIDTFAASAVAPTAPTGWSTAYGPSSAYNGDAVGYSVFYKTAAGGVESPVFNAPNGSGVQLYAKGIITEWSSMGSHDTADSSATTTNNSAASTTGVTVSNTGTLANANSTVFTGVAILSGAGLANAGIAFSGGSWTTETSEQDTSSSVGMLVGDKVVSANTALGATYTWTSDSTMVAYQAAVVVFSDSGGGGSSIKKQPPQMTGGFSDMTGGTA